MTDATVEFVLQSVKELVIFNAELLGNAKSDAQSLQRDLVVLQEFVKETEDNPNIGSAQQAALNSIKEVLNGAEDAIDDFVVERAKHQEKNALLKLVDLPKHKKAIRNIALKVRDIRVDVEKIKADNPIQFHHSRELRPARSQVPIVEEEDVVGFDGEAEKVISFLREGSPELDVLGIVGMPGLGKTTLAHKIYKDETVDFEFIHRHWVYVSKEGRAEDVFISILKKFSDLSEADLNSKDNAELTEELKECLKGKKYLIVLDDVWTTETWDELRAGFPNNDKRSRILLTTRYQKVAQYANRNRVFHNLKFLSEAEGWELLEKRVFGKTEKCPSSLTKLGQSVAKKCEGLPLAIVVIAGIILTNRFKEYTWRQVDGRVSDYIVHKSVKFNEVVDWSFKSLPYNLKSCFLYFGVFPRGTIPVWKLVRLWIAEGFIEDDTGVGLENAAADLLDELVDRNLVMATARGLDGRIQACRVHDTVRDFCKLVAEKKKLYHEMDAASSGPLTNYRRICIHSNVQGYIALKPSGEGVRSFLTFNPESKTELQATELSKWLKAFAKLRILEANSLKFPRFPRQFQDMALLRYLAFSCDFSRIPAYISSLWSLQTLIISTTKVVLEFEESIWKLYRLRHLQTNASAKLPSPSDSNQALGRENVQTLSTIAPESCTVEVFQRAPNLQKLGVRGELAMLLEDGSKLIENLGKLKFLTNLKLYNNAISQSSIENLSRKFPKKLRKLTLSNTSLSWEHMSILGALDSLEVVKLKDNAFRGEVWKSDWGSFPSLKVLYIDRTNLKSWGASEEQFQRLTRLIIKNCDRLEAVPACFGNLSDFQSLDIYCSSIVAKSAKGLKGKNFKLYVYPPETKK